MKKLCGSVIVICLLVLVVASLCGPAGAFWPGWNQYLAFIGAPAGSLPGLCFQTFSFDVPAGEDPADTSVWAHYSGMMAHMHNADATHSCPRGLGGTYNEMFRLLELDHLIVSSFSV